MLKKSKKTFFEDNSKGKKAFPGGIKGKKQPKYMVKPGKKPKQKKQTVGKGVKQPTVGSGHPVQKRQEHLVAKQKQPKYQMDAEMNARIRRATGG